MEDLLNQSSVYQFKVVRQMVREPNLTAKSSKDVYEHFRFMDQYDREHMVRVDLNRATEILGHEHVSIGTDNGTIVGPKEVFRGALLSGASSIILVHNHPSGKTNPSSEDKQVAQRLQHVGVELDLQLLDFVIIGRNGNYYSFSENELL